MGIRWYETPSGLLYSYGTYKRDKVSQSTRVANLVGSGQKSTQSFFQKAPKVEVGKFSVGPISEGRPQKGRLRDLEYLFSVRWRSTGTDLRNGLLDTCIKIPVTEYGDSSLTKQYVVIYFVHWSMWSTPELIHGRVTVYIKNRKSNPYVFRIIPYETV